tara:strand:- start:373 stop:2487 length:2115 start_codon:yes stop_codon:yes gene_type:complete
MKNQHLIDNLSTSEKADLFQHLYAELAGQGTDGDTELAHVNRFEAQVLRNIGGSGTVNKVTGLRQYGKGGSAPPPPSSTTTRQVPEYAPEQREYIEDIFGKSQELYEQRSEEGFTPFPGQQLAPFAAQETEAFGGIESLARGPGAAPAFGIARNAALGAAAPITAGEVQQGMNPYQQAVTDIGKREAVRQYQRGPQAQLRSGAVEAGGLRGARRFIEEGEGQRNLNQQLGDIQTLGSQQAFQQSMAEAAAARGRLANLATQMPSIGMGAYNQQMQQLGQLGGVGEAYRSRDQAAIGLAQDQFQQEQMFPEETLATYLRFITNAPSPSGFQRTTQTPGVRGPSALTQIGGGLMGGAALGKAFNMFSRGGAVGRQAGLSGIVRRAGGGQIVRMQQGGPPPRTSFGRDLEGVENFIDRSFVNIPGAEERRLADLKRMQNSPFNQVIDYFFEDEGTAAVTQATREAIPADISGQAEPDLFVDPNMELVEGLEKESKPEKETVVAETPAPEQKTISFKQVEAPASAPQETKSAFMSGLDDLSTGDLLKMAGAFFTAGGQGSTGSMTNDALNLLGSAGVTAGDVMSKAQKRKLSAAEKAELLDLKKREVAARETTAKAAVIKAKKDNLPVFKAPSANDVANAKINLESGPYEKVSDAAVTYIAAMQKAYPNATIEQVAALLEANGSLVKDNTGFFSFIGGGTPTLQRVGE